MPLKRVSKNMIDQDFVQEVEQTKAELAQTMNKNPIYLADYGVSASATATNNTTNINLAIRDAEAQGRPIIFPFTAPNEYIDVNDEINFVVGGIELLGFGRNTKLRQLTFMKKLIHANKPNLYIHDLSLYGVDFDATGTEAMHVLYAGVYIEASNVTVENIYGDLLSTVINATSTSSSQLMENVSVKNIESGKNVVFNLLISGTKNFYFDNIRGSYRFMTGVGTPPHLIYFSNAASDGRGGNNYDVKGGSAYAFDSADGHAYTLKAIIGGEIDKLSANNCNGVLTARESEYLTIERVYSDNDIYPDSAGSLQVQHSTPAIKSLKINHIRIKMNGDGAALRVYGSNHVLKNVDITTNHSVTNESYDNTDVLLHGTENTIENISVNNISSFYVWASIVVKGNDCKLIRPKTKGNKIGVAVTGGTGSEILDYLLTDLGYLSALSASAPLDMYVSAKIRPNEIIEENILLAYDRQNTRKGLVTMLSSGHVPVKRSGWYIDANNRMYSTGHHSILYPELTTPNIDLSAGIKYKNKEGFTIRYIDVNNMLNIGLNHTYNRVEIIDYTDSAGSVFTLLASTPFTVQIGRRYHLRVKVFGDLIEVFVDGEKLLTHTLSAEMMTKYGEVTNHGLVGYGEVDGLFDNIEWRRLD